MDVEKEVVARPLISRELLDKLSDSTTMLIIDDIYQSDFARYRMLSGHAFMSPEVIRMHLLELCSFAAVEGEGGG